MGKKGVAHGVSPIVKIVVIVARHLNLIASRVLAHVIGESHIVQTIDAPGATAECKSLRHNFAFQPVRETVTLMLLLEENRDGCASRT